MFIASDLDHVMCDVTGQARKVIAADLGVPVNEIIETNIYHAAFAHSDPELNDRIKLEHSFWEREEVLRYAQPMPGAVEAAWRMYESGMLVSYVTRRSPEVSTVTHAWLREWNFPDVPTYFVGTSNAATVYLDCKTAACLKSGATMLIDDSPQEVARVLDAGFSAILLDAPVGRAARKAFLQDRPDVLCLPSIVEAVDYLMDMRQAA